MKNYNLNIKKKQNNFKINIKKILTNKYQAHLNNVNIFYGKMNKTFFKKNTN